MLLVQRELVGAAAFSRLARSGLIHDVLGASALPADVPSSRPVRAHMVAPWIPAHTWLTGLAALWLEGFARTPAVLDLAGPRGAHRTVPAPGSPPLAFHSGWLWGLPDAGPPRAATVARACLDALAHSGAVDALPAVASALRGGATTVGELEAGVAIIERHTHYRARVRSLVGALATLDAG